MTKEALSLILKDMYENAPRGDRTTMIRLFGIKYADELTSCPSPMKEIAELSSVGESYHAEISKGISLSKYVKLK